MAFEHTIPLFWWHWNLNFGDYLSPYIVQKLSTCKVMDQGFPIIDSFRCSLYSLLRRGRLDINNLKESLHNAKTYLVGLGSVVTASSKNAYVWGSGFQRPDIPLKEAMFAL
jgi:hypothetical protein